MDGTQTCQTGTWVKVDVGLDPDPDLDLLWHWRLHFRSAPARSFPFRSRPVQSQFPWMAESIDLPCFLHLGLDSSSLLHPTTCALPLPETYPVFTSSSVFANLGPCPSSERAYMRLPCTSIRFLSSHFTCQSLYFDSTASLVHPALTFQPTPLHLTLLTTADVHVER